MTELTKTREWLKEATGTPKTQEEAEWFLVYDHVAMFSDLTQKHLAQEIASYIKCPLTYESMEQVFFECMKDESKQAIKDYYVQPARDFYGLK